MHVTHKLIGAAFGLLTAITAARAETVSLAAQLFGSNAIPQNKSDAFGEGQFRYDGQTGKLDYYLTYDGTAPTRIDLHGPARAGENAAPVLAFPLSASPLSGSVTLTKAQADSLLAGTLYVDMHSAAYAEGEIRGQIKKQ
ncbi:MAG: CHRD domain-containing protein [Proteobacteria bacterium]|nr:CHRD domain-containing protein [Pseudomonadota bacterium]